MADFNSIRLGASDDGKTWSNVTGTALSATTRFHQVVVDGTGADTLNLGAGFTQVGTVSNGTATYNVYQNTATNSQVIADSAITNVVMDLAPTLVSTSPVDNSNVAFADAGNNLSLTFNEVVTKGTGLIQLYNASTNALVESFDAASSSLVTGWGTSTLTINPSANLLGATGYYVKVAPTAVQDLGGNAYAGITDTTTFNFGVLGSDGSIPVVPPYGGQPSSQLGRSVSSAGDVNGDGYEDMIVGAAGTPAAYVVYGSASGAGVSLTSGTIDSSLGFKITGASNTGLGFSVSNAGDVNGDGYADVIVSAPNTSSNTGVSYVVYGKAVNTGLNLSSGTIAASDGFSLTGQAANSYSGWSVSGAGDVNGDGLTDLLVGTGNGGTGGSAYVVYGSTNNTSLSFAGGTIAPEKGYQLTGLSSSYTVSSAGDVNGDGLADQIVGVYGVNSTAGAAYLVYGRSNGTGLNFANPMAASDGFRINGISDKYLGYAVSGAGDVNGDGLADFAVGTYTSGHEAYVIYGSTAGSEISLNASGNIPSSRGFKIIGATTDLNSFGASLSNVGDVNGDGLDDIVVGAYRDGAERGSAYVVYGNASGTNVDISTDTIAASNGFKLAINTDNSYFGEGISGAGDINGDGLADIIIGARLTNSSAGAYYIVLGGTNTVTNAVNLTGTSSGEAVLGTAGNDVLIGNGGVDRFFAGKGNDTIVLQASDVTNLASNSGTTRALVNAGTGFDTLRLNGTNLDLTTISNIGAMGLEENSRIESIERIDMATDTGANTLSIAAKDVADMADFNSIRLGASDDGKTWSNVSGTALSATTKFHQVVVEGTSADTLNLEAGNGYWANVGEVNNGTTGYFVYQNTTMNSQVIVDKTVVVNNKDGNPAGETVIPLGPNGKLIAPVQVEGKWYYYWDKSGNGTAGTEDQMTHDTLDAIFRYDINGIINPLANTNTNSVYRYSYINGIQLALPTLNGDVKFVWNGNNVQGTAYADGGATSNGTFSTEYDELLAIIDAYNGTTLGFNARSSALQTKWGPAYIWAADDAVPDVNYHANVYTDGSYMNYGGANHLDAMLNIAALQVVGANTAPVLNAAASPTLTGVSSSAAAPVNGSTTGSDLVSSLVAGITDADSGALKGIAVTGVGTGGTLYYSLDGGTTWLTPSTTLSNTNALLLAADNNTRVFYRPNGTNGTITDAITFRAWDQTQNITEGVFVNTFSQGGKAQFSTATDTVAITAVVPDTTAPTLLSSSPADNGSVASANLATNLTLTFSEAVKAGTGLIELYNASNTLVESFDVATSTKVTGWNGSTLTINPTNDLTEGTGYYVKVATTAVKDLADNAYAGITAATTLNFTVDPSAFTVMNVRLYAINPASVTNTYASYTGAPAYVAGGTFTFHDEATNAVVYTRNQWDGGGFSNSFDNSAFVTGRTYYGQLNYPSGASYRLKNSLIYNGPGVTPTETNILTSPLVLDLNGDGVQTTDTANGVQFDLFNSGTPQKTSWVDKHDGLLAIDLNSDGLVNSGAELLGSSTLLADGSVASDGWAALAGMDSNMDGKIDLSDANFDKLRVWVDADTDGMTDAGELKTLADVGIVSFDVAHDNSVTQQNGNVLQGVSKYTTTSGETRDVVDVWLQATPLAAEASAKATAENLAATAFADSTATDAEVAAHFANQLADKLADQLANQSADQSVQAAEFQNKPYELSTEEMSQLGLSELVASLLAGANTQVIAEELAALNLSGAGLAQVIDAVSEVASELTAEELASLGLTETGVAAAIDVVSEVSSQLPPAPEVCLPAADSSTYSLSNGQSLDLTTVLKDMSYNGIVKGLEQVDMATDTAANVVSLSLADVLSMPPIDGVYKLVLSGAANDKVMLTEGEWTDTGAVVDQGGHSYAVYTGTNDSSAQLLIDQQMLQS
jgi:methionine-rich copper-binding protein CopC